MFRTLKKAIKHTDAEDWVWYPKTRGFVKAECEKLKIVVRKDACENPKVYVDGLQLSWWVNYRTLKLIRKLREKWTEEKMHCAVDSMIESKIQTLNKQLEDWRNK